MSATTRVNGDGFFATGALVSVYQQKAIVITVKGASTAVDLQSLDDGVDELVSLVVKEVQPLMYYTVSDSSGVIYAIIDGHAVDAAVLQDRVRNVVAGKLGTASVSTVAVGTTFTVA